jgi:hypothetical protein
MSQANQFPPDLRAPEAWVREIEGHRAGSAHWQDESYGNDAAPSWMLIDDNEGAHAQAFYYTLENAERYDRRFQDAPYVALSILRDNQIFASCCLAPDAFLAAIAVASSSTVPTPLDALRAGLDSVSGVMWDEALNQAV